MYASMGDRIIISGRTGKGSRDCTVLQVLGLNGAPPYVVRWEDCDQRSLFFPGPDATVVSREVVHPHSSVL